MDKTFPEGIFPLELLAPAADAAGRTGDYISLKYAHRLYLIAHLTQGNAATVALTPTQASAVAGTGAKALTNAVRIWANQDTATGQALVRQTDAKDFTTSAAVKNKLVIFEITPAALDVANDFDCITLVTGASNAANITQAMAHVVPRYPQATAPSFITD